MLTKTRVQAVVVIWFAIGGLGHFFAPGFFLTIVPPYLPYRLEAVYISGLFELLGALGVLVPRLRRIAGIGLLTLTVAVTPANLYMWTHAHLFSSIPETMLALRLALQAVLLAGIWWSCVARAPNGHA